MIGRLAVALLLLSAGAQAQPAAPHQPAAQQWNPRPAEGDLVLPLPCASGIAFRRITTPMPDSPLADRRVVLGDEEAGAAYSEFVRETHVAGSFGQGAAAHFWLAKYEVTRGQYVAVLEGCEAYNKLTPAQLRLPQSEVTMVDALRFAEAATTQVLKLQKTALPGNDDARAFLRLPSEAEWEYAVRGGAAVTDAEFRQRLPPMDGPITASAQLRRTGQRPVALAVGLLAPDRLGLHDMLGNVAEMVADPYRLTRGGRTGGRTGGVIGRGGDVSSTADQVRSSQRVEYPLFTPDGEVTRPATLGFRVALGLPIITHVGASGALRQAWEKELAQQDAALGPAADPRALAEQLEAQIVDPAQKRAVATLRSTVENERSRRVQADERAARSAIGAGAVLIRAYRNEYNVAQGAAGVVAEFEASLKTLPRGGDERQRRQIEKELTEARGLPAYEISNHAPAGEESRHNLVYWRYGEYAGVGPGAHGRLIVGPDRHALVTQRQPEMWAEAVEGDGHGLVEDETLSPSAQADELLLMGLRLTEGVDLSRLEAVGGVRPSRSRRSRLASLGMLEEPQRDHIRVTRAGRFVLNEIVRQLSLSMDEPVPSERA